MPTKGRETLAVKPEASQKGSNMILSSKLERKRWLYSCKVYDRQKFVVVVDGFNEVVYSYRLVGLID